MRCILITAWRSNPKMETHSNGVLAKRWGVGVGSKKRGCGGG